MPRTMCGCGSKLPGPEWPDCGKDGCVSRSSDFGITRRARTERFEDILEVVAENRALRDENAVKTERSAITTAKSIVNQIAHENLLRMYAQMRTEEALQRERGWDD